MKWSEQQEAVFEWFKKGPSTGHGIVRARAGTGKTTTIMEGVQHAPERSILVMAFSRFVKEELESRIAKMGLRNVVAKTSHGVGYDFVRDNWRNAKLEGQYDWPRRAWRHAMLHMGDQAPDDMIEHVVELAGLGKTLLLDFSMGKDFHHAMVELACSFGCIPDKEWQKEGWTADKIADLAMKVMETAKKRPSGRPDDPLAIDYNDMLFLPLANEWIRPRWDLVVVDEAQDFNIVQLEIAQRVLKPGGRILLVGDDCQAIFAFRGADSDALDRLKVALSASEMKLTKTFRCGKRIVESAQKLVADFEAFEDNHLGDVVANGPKVADLIHIVKPGDFILSRINAPLASICLKFIRAGIPAKIMGRDVAAPMRRLVKRWHPKSVDKLLENITRWQEREKGKLAGLYGQESQLAFIDDMAETLLALCDGISHPKELLTRLDDMFGDPDVGNHKPIVRISSVHRAKGLEAGSVYVLGWTFYPEWSKKNPKLHREEVNLDYVAQTRAIDKLVFCSKK